MERYLIQLIEWMKLPTDKSLRSGVLKCRHESTVEATNFSMAQNKAFDFYGTDGRGMKPSANHYKWKVRVRKIDGGGAMDFQLPQD